MKLRSWCLATGLLAVQSLSWAQITAQDPLSSSMWGYFHERMLEKKDYVFDSSIKVSVPPFAENSAQVPIEIDARQLTGNIQKAVVWAELNPIPQVLTYTPLQADSLENFMALRIRVEQATPIRAAFLMSDGVWHIGSARVEAEGGGCTMPSTSRAEEGWEKNLGKLLGARFELPDSSRLRVNISHPMDNGLNSSIPEFFLDKAELRNQQGEVLAKLDLFASLSENPTITLGVRNQGQTTLWLADNNGNEFVANLP